MAELNDKNKTSLLSGSSCEIIFRLNSRWTSIFVKPILSQANLLHYLVKLLDGTELFLRNKDGEWTEVKGERSNYSKAFGEAIEKYYWQPGALI